MKYQEVFLERVLITAAVVVCAVLLLRRLRRRILNKIRGDAGVRLQMSNDFAFPGRD
jgi:hypothetical protein